MIKYPDMMTLSFEQFEALTYNLYSTKDGQPATRPFAQKISRQTITQLITLGFTSKDGAVTKLGLAVLEQYRVKRAIILGAGLGSRMMPATKDIPKPMVTVNGKRFIETQIDALLAAGIEDITVVRGHNGNAFDVLLKAYPMLKFVENARDKVSNNIVSTYLARDLLESCYVIEDDLLIKNPSVLRKYEYRSHYCSVPTNGSEDWYFSTDKDSITDVNFGAQLTQDQYLGISFWTPADAQQLKLDLEQALKNPANEQIFLEAVPLKLYPEHYKLYIRRLQKEDVIEVDTYQELQQLDQSYR